MDGGNEDNLTSSLSTMAISASTAASLPSSQSVASSTSPTSAARSPTGHNEPLPPGSCKYVKTRGYRAVKQALEDEGRVLVCGSPGSGKTYMAMALQQWYRKNDYNVISPRNIRYFCLHDFIHSQSKTFLVLDDIFGRFMANTSEIAHCFQLLDDIEHHIRSLERQNRDKDEMSFKVLLNSRTDIFVDMEGRLERYKHFLLRPVCIVNLTLNEETKLQRDERGDILSAHLQHVGISLSDEIKRIISEDDYKTLGFPYICQMFVERRTSSINPVDFFQKPLTILDDEISRIFLDQQTKAAVLLLLILTDGSFNLAHLANPDTNTAKQLCKLDEILESLPSKQSLPKELGKAAKSLIGTYVTCAKDVVTFSHPTIYDAVAYTVGKLRETFVLSNCSLKFIVERVDYEKDIVVSGRSNFKKLIVIGESFIEMLIQRLTTEMQNGCIALSMSHKALLQKDVFEKLVTELKTRRVLGDIIHERDADENGLSFLFWASYTGVWKTGFLDVLAKPHFCVAEYLEAYLSACVSNNVEAFQELKLHAGSLDGQAASATLSVIVPGAERKILMSSQEVKKVTVVVSRRHDRNLDHLIHIASANGHLDIVNLLLDMGININDAGGMGMTPLMYGSYGGHCDLVKMLLIRGAYTDMKNDDNDNCLHLAVRGGFSDIVKLLLKTMDPDCRGRYDRTPLMYAAYDGHREVLDLLIEFRACLQPEQTEVNRNNSLHEACAAGQQDIVELLVETHQMDIEQIGHYGNTPLLAACQRGRLETVKYLISKNAMKNVCDDKGNNCVLLSAFSGDVDTVRWLLDEKGFDIESQNNMKQTPLMCCTSAEVLKVLLEKGADVNEKDSSNATCISNVAKRGNLEMIEILTRKGVGIDEPGMKNRTPLMVACMFGREAIFNFLKEREARLNLEDENKSNCLHLACNGANINIVKNLLNTNNFDINRKSNFNQSPLEIAVRVNSPDLIYLLLTKGSNLDPLILHFAAKCGSIEATEKLLQCQHGLDIDFQHSDGNTPIMVAVMHGKEDMFMFLLSRGASLTLRNNYGQTILHVACKSKVINMEIIKELLKNELSPRGKDNQRKTPDMYIFDQMKRREVVELFRSKSASAESWRK